MKKGILIFGVLAILSLTASSYMNWNNSDCQVATCQKEPPNNEKAVKAAIPDFAAVNRANTNLTPSCAAKPKIDFVYNIDSRFIWHVTKEQIKNAKSIRDIYPKDAIKGDKDFSNVQVTVMKNSMEISEFGNSENLNKEQLELLQTLDYSSNFYIRADVKKTEYITKWEADEYIVYYMTVVPEKEAVYSKGQDALIDYLKANTEKDIARLEEDKLRPGQISFTVTTTGKVTNVALDSSSGYEKLDEKMVKLIEKMPERWNAATNEKGEKVEQTLTFFYGVQGC